MSEITRVYFQLNPQDDGRVIVSAIGHRGVLAIRGRGVDGEDHEFDGTTVVSPKGENLFFSDDNGPVFQQVSDGTWQRRSGIDTTDSLL